jgi:hypothetical protein
MTAQVTFNPYATSVAQGLFNTSSYGLRQGTAYPDPSTRWRLRGGYLSTNETLPMWGGVGVYEFVPGVAGQPVVAIGPQVGRATALTGANPLAGFSVFDQAYGMISSPQSPVPLIGTYGQVMYYPLGSLARIAVACDPNLVSLQGGPTNPNVSWDFVNQQLVPYASTTISSATYTSSATVSSGTYNTVTGAVSLTLSAAHGLSVGDAFTLSAMTGTGAFATLNGTWTATAGTTGSTLNFTAPTGLTMTITGGTNGTGVIALTTAANHGLKVGDTFELNTLTGTGSYAAQNGEHTASNGTNATTGLSYLVATGLTLTVTGGNVVTGGLLPVKVLDVQQTNCETVTYNSTTGFATWNFNGCCAVIQI